MTGNDNIVKAILTDANAYADAVSVEAHKNAEKLSVEAKAYRDETVRAAKAEAEKVRCCRQFYSFRAKWRSCREKLLFADRISRRCQKQSSVQSVAAVWGSCFRSLERP